MVAAMPYACCTKYSLGSGKRKWFQRNATIASSLCMKEKDPNRSAAIIKG